MHGPKKETRKKAGNGVEDAKRRGKKEQKEQGKKPGNGAKEKNTKKWLGGNQGKRK